MKTGSDSGSGSGTQGLFKLGAMLDGIVVGAGSCLSGGHSAIPYPSSQELPCTSASGQVLSTL